MPVLSNPDNSSPSQVSDSGADPNISTNRPWRRHSFRVALAFGVGGVAAAAVIFYGVNDTVIDEEETITRAVASAEVRDLVEFNDLSGRMVYADVKPIVSSEDGVITDVLHSGDTIERGTVLYAINDSPTAAFYGTFPLYRKLSEGAVGEDVIVLKKNLSALGYHSFEEDDGTMIDTGFVVDNVFDDSTTEAVKRWQKDQGAEESGVVSPSDVIVLNGPAEVADVSTDVGQRVNLGTRIMDLNMLGIVDTVHYEHSGQVETLVTSGQEIASGDLLYAIDNRAVTAMISEATFDRDIEEGVKSGDDVRAVEDMLFSLGYDVKGDLEVDDVFDDVTKQAITEWQEDLGRTFDGVVVNGIISLGDLIVFEPGTVATVLKPELAGLRSKAADDVSTGKVNQAGAERFFLGEENGVMRQVVNLVEAEIQHEGGTGKIHVAQLLGSIFFQHPFGHQMFHGIAKIGVEHRFIGMNHFP